MLLVTTNNTSQKSVACIIWQLGQCNQFLPTASSRHMAIGGSHNLGGFAATKYGESLRGLELVNSAASDERVSCVPLLLGILRPQLKSVVQLRRIERANRAFSSSRLTQLTI